MGRITFTIEKKGQEEARLSPWPRRQGVREEAFLSGVKKRELKPAHCCKRVRRKVKPEKFLTGSLQRVTPKDLLCGKKRHQWRKKQFPKAAYSKR